MQWVEETETDSIELICRIDVKHKARNNNVSGSSVIGNGRGKHRSRDRVVREIDGRLVGVKRRVGRVGDKHGISKFFVMLAVYSTWHVKSKVQTKVYRLTVNHLKSLYTRKWNLRAKRRGMDLRCLYMDQ